MQRVPCWVAGQSLILIKRKPARGYHGGLDTSERRNALKMFRVMADSLEAYLYFDPYRKRDLLQFHEVMVSSAPALKRYFHEGTPAGSRVCA